MFDHIGLRVKNVEKAAQLYAAMLAPLGFVQGPSGKEYAGFGPKDAPALWLNRSASAKKGCHVALRAPSRASVNEFFKKGLKAGARDNGKPGVRTDYAPNYYAAFLLDSDGNNVEAVHMD
ncbi:MAG TPA: VOC family protein [Burkholderiales bacterium]